MKMENHAHVEALSTMDEICDFTQDAPSSSDCQLSTMTQEPVDSLSLVDCVLDKLDSLLDIVSLSDKDPVSVDAPTSSVSVSTSSQTQQCGEMFLYARKPGTCSINTQTSDSISAQPRTSTIETQTSDDLMSDSISAMKTKVTESRCKLDVMTEYYKSVTYDFRNVIGRQTFATEKAKADLETSQKQLAEIQTKLAQLEKESASQVGDTSHPLEEPEPEYKPENIHGYRPRPRKNFEIKEHYFPGETLPPAWARVTPVQSQEQSQWVESHSRGNMPPPRPCYNQGYRSSIPPPPPRHRPYSAPGSGRVPPVGDHHAPPAYTPRRCRSELVNRIPAGMPMLPPPPPPPPGFFMAPPRCFMPPPPTQEECQMETQPGDASSPPRPGDLVVRPFAPCGTGNGQKVRFGFTETLYI